MNAWGGQRPGSGRKTKAERHATAIDHAEGRIVDHLPELVDKLLEVAMGNPPNVKVLVYLLDRVMGKPTERQEISGPDAGPVELSPILLSALDRVYGDPSDHKEPALADVG